MMTRVSLDYGIPTITASIYFPKLTIDYDGFYADLGEIIVLDDIEEYYIMPYILNKYTPRVGIKLTQAEFASWKIGVSPLSDFFGKKQKWFKFVFDNSFKLYTAYTTPIVCNIQIIPTRKPSKSFIQKITMDATRNT